MGVHVTAIIEDTGYTEFTSSSGVGSDVINVVSVKAIFVLPFTLERFFV